jgi:hypothetical protein
MAHLTIVPMDVEGVTATHVGRWKTRAAMMWEGTQFATGQSILDALGSLNAFDTTMNRC